MFDTYVYVRVAHYAALCHCHDREPRRPPARTLLEDAPTLATYTTYSIYIYNYINYNIHTTSSICLYIYIHHNIHHAEVLPRQGAHLKIYRLRTMTVSAPSSFLSGVFPVLVDFFV